MNINGITGMFALLYLMLVFGLGLYILVLLSRFVRAHQRGAEALELIARKLPDNTKLL